MTRRTIRVRDEIIVGAVGRAVPERTALKRRQRLTTAPPPVDPTPTGLPPPRISSRDRPPAFRWLSSKISLGVKKGKEAIGVLSLTEGFGIGCTRKDAPV